MLWHLQGLYGASVMRYAVTVSAVQPMITVIVVDAEDPYEAERKACDIAEIEPELHEWLKGPIDLDDVIAEDVQEVYDGIDETDDSSTGAE